MMKTIPVEARIAVIGNAFRNKCAISGKNANCYIEYDRDLVVPYYDANPVLNTLTTINSKYAGCRYDRFIPIYKYTELGKIPFYLGNPKIILYRLAENYLGEIDVAYAVIRNYIDNTTPMWICNYTNDFSVAYNEFAKESGIHRYFPGEES